MCAILSTSKQSEDKYKNKTMKELYEILFCQRECYSRLEQNENGTLIFRTFLRMDLKDQQTVSFTKKLFIPCLNETTKKMEKIILFSVKNDIV